jgi:prepilin-type N-terminal cleavage/methylation domain-containing protein
MKAFTLASGFTLIEMMTTIFVASFFILSLTTLYGSVNAATTNDRRRADASSIAYSYLRKWTASGNTTLNTFVCDMASGSSNTNDLTINSNAAGQSLESVSATSPYGSLPLPAKYEVRAFAPYGCSGSNSDKPLRIDATVTYGSPATTVKHSTYLGDN